MSSLIQWHLNKEQNRVGVGVNRENIYEEEVQVERALDAKNLMWKSAVLGVLRMRKEGFQTGLKWTRRRVTREEVREGSHLACHSKPLTIYLVRDKKSQEEFEHIYWVVLLFCEEINSRKAKKNPQKIIVIILVKDVGDLEWNSGGNGKYIHISVYMYTHIFIYMYRYVYIHTLYAYRYICIYMYICTFTWRW